MPRLLIVDDDEPFRLAMRNAFLRRGFEVSLAGSADEAQAALQKEPPGTPDRKSTRLNSSHRCISYAVFCLKKKKLFRLEDVGPPLEERSGEPGRDPGRKLRARIQRLTSDRAWRPAGEQADLVVHDRDRLHDGRDGGGGLRAVRLDPIELEAVRHAALESIPEIRHGLVVEPQVLLLNVEPPTELSTLSLHDALPI